MGSTSEAGEGGSVRDKSPSAELTEALVNMSQLIGPMLEASCGYRQQAEAAGFSPTAAEEMAVRYHAFVWAALAAAQTKGAA